MSTMIAGASALLSGYDVLFCDVWGVLHNGVHEYEAAGDALERFRAKGGSVVLVSNAPIPARSVATYLGTKQVRESAWDAIITSGDVARSHLEDKGYHRVHHIGQDRDLPIFDKLGVKLVGLDEAEVIMCTGLVDDRSETGEHYRARLSDAAKRKLPFICANPDLVVDVGGTLLPCAGAITKVYQSMGGPIYWAGKPHRAVYKAAWAAAKRIRGTELKRHQILAIGDAVITDLIGAREFGVDALFITGGIHRRDLMETGEIDHDRLRHVLEENSVTPVGVATALAW